MSGLVTGGLSVDDRFAAIERRLHEQENAPPPPHTLNQSALGPATTISAKTPTPGWFAARMNTDDRLDRENILAQHRANLRQLKGADTGRSVSEKVGGGLKKGLIGVGVVSALGVTAVGAGVFGAVAGGGIESMQTTGALLGEGECGGLGGFL